MSQGDPGGTPQLAPLIGNQKLSTSTAGVAPWPGGARRSQEDPGGARRSQEEATRSQEELGGARGPASLVGKPTKRLP